MHDGRFAKLEEVIERHDQGIQSSATLNSNLAKHLSHDGRGSAMKTSRRWSAS
jgi:hypothetical protein